MKYLRLEFLYILIFSFSCISKTDSIEESLEFELEVIDSIQIPVLENLTLLDVHPKKDLFLFSVDGKNSPLVLTNDKGLEIKRLEAPSDAPNGFGGYCSSGIFMGDTIVVQGVRGLYFYDLNLNFLKNNNRTYPPKGMIFLGFDHLKYAETYLGPSLISFSGNPQTELPPNDPGYYQNYNALDLIPLDSIEFKPILPFTPESRFLKSEEAFNFISLSFSVKDHLLTYAHQNDTLLYEVYLLDPSLIQKPIGIPFDQFIFKKGFPYGGQEDYESPSDIQGSISSIFKVENIDLIFYTSGLKMENFPPSNDDRSQYRDAIEILNPKKWIVRSDGNRFSQPKLAPSSYRISRVDQRNRIWAQQNIEALDEEPEVNTFYQIKLVRK